MDPLKGFRDPRHHEATKDAFGALVGPPPQRYPNLIQLREAGMALARRVIYPKEPCPLKKAHAYLVKYLLLVHEQREELESDLKPDVFLKPLEKQASFKGTFDFRNKMNAQQRAQRAALVPLFTIVDGL